MSLREAARALAAGIPDDVTWAVTASGNLGLRGLPVDPGDLDVKTDEPGAYAIADAFSEAVLEPVEPPGSNDADWIRSHYGRLRLAGVDVDLVGDALIHRDGEWQATAPVASHREYVAVDGVEVPVMSLEYERDGYALRGDDERLAVVEGAL
jgi:hypothetical protein